MVYKIIITAKNVDKIYDKIFQILDKYSTIFKCETENEYNTNNGYVLELKSIPPEALEALENLNGIVIE